MQAAAIVLSLRLDSEYWNGVCVQLSALNPTPSRRVHRIIFPVAGMRTYFLWLSVSVMPCDDTLKCTTVAVGGEAAVRVSEMALEMAWGPVKDSISTELM